MPRVKTGIVRRKRHKKVLKEAKGYRGAIKTNYKKANEAVKKAMAYATEHRKLKKRRLLKELFNLFRSYSRGVESSYQSPTTSSRNSYWTKLILFQGFE